MRQSEDLGVIEPFAPPAEVQQTHWSRRLGSGLVAFAALAALVLAVVVAARPTVAPAAGPPQGARPTIIVQVEGAPYSVVAWYVDGTQGDASAAISGRWMPDRALLLLTVAAGKACSITVDDRLATAQTAPINRLAVCVWRAP